MPTQPTGDDLAALAPLWVSAARAGTPAATELEAVHETVRRAVEERGPACWASGRCCNFAQSGHRLYATGLEAAHTLLRLGARAPTPGGLPILAAPATPAPVCPLREGNLCGAHAVRPTGCRIYFCDRSAQGWQRELYERTHGEVRALHERHGVPYRYAEWTGLLAAVGSALPGLPWLPGFPGLTGLTWS